MVHVRVILGKGAYIPSGSDFGKDDKDDPFAMVLGDKELGEKSEDTVSTKTEEEDEDIGDKGVDGKDNKPKPSDSTETDPVVDHEKPDQTDLAEYGYGFWLRFLTAYP
jgi:hypothetical protein